jgi:hypothetical protein
MWIRKSPTEINPEKRIKLLCATYLDVLLGTSLWYILVRLSALLGPPFQGPVSGYVCCGVIAILLPAAWYANWRELHEKKGPHDKSGPANFRGVLGSLFHAD